MGDLQHLRLDAGVRRSELPHWRVGAERRCDRRRRRGLDPHCISDYFVRDDHQSARFSATKALDAGLGRDRDVGSRCSATSGYGGDLYGNAERRHGTLQYKWLVYDGLSWVPVTGWTTSTMYAWRASRADPNYRVGVWVRSAGSSVDAPEASSSIPFPIR